MKVCTKCGSSKNRFYDKHNQCVECVKEANEVRRQANPEKRLAYERERHKRDPANRRGRVLKSMYGITIAQYDELLASQNGVCALCGSKPGKRRLAVDHCHETGLIRGLLCWKCNPGLGYFQDDPALLRAAARYLEEKSSASMC